MARADKNGMIDGYMAVQSVRRNSDRQHDRERPGTADKADTTPQPPTHPPVPAKPHGIGHTALPTKHKLHCYACGYQFVITGQLDRLLCPKCKEQLHTGDKTICGPFTGTVQTVGTVTIHSGAQVTHSHITASVIRIAGICRNTHLHPGLRVELATGAAVDNAKLESVDVAIAMDQTVTLDTDLHCKSLTIEGNLRANVHAREMVAIQEQATFQGRLKAALLTVADGATIRADLHIKPQPKQHAESQA